MADITTSDLEKLLNNGGGQHTTEHLTITPGEEEQSNPLETLHVYQLGEGLYVTKTPLEEDAAGVPLLPDLATESMVPAQPRPKQRIVKEQVLAGILTVLFLCFLLFNTTKAFYITFIQVTTVTLTATEKTISSTQTMHLVQGLPTSPTQIQERDLPAITLTQQKTGAATGSYHQDPTYAVGYITFYNASFSSVSIAAGTQLQGADGIQIVTTQDTTVPGVDQAATPPALGQATAAARALSMGAAGNVQAFDINGQCCTASILAKNTQAFAGGQDAQTYTIVTQKDITGPVATLTTSLLQSTRAALMAQARHDEALLLSPCTPIISTDHKVGDEATSVHITATATCRAVAYNARQLHNQTTALFTHDAMKTLGQSYRLLGTAACTSPPATTNQPLGSLVLSCHGLWAYLPSEADQQQMKHDIAGKQVTQATRILLSESGIKKVAIDTVGTSLPTDIQRIHFLFLYSPR